MKDETICFDDALLEIKLALDDGEEPPAWLTELLESGDHIGAPFASGFPLTPPSPRRVAA